MITPVREVLRVEQRNARPHWVKDDCYKKARLTAGDGPTFASVLLKATLALEAAPNTFTGLLEPKKGN